MSKWLNDLAAKVAAMTPGEWSGTPHFSCHAEITAASAKTSNNERGCILEQRCIGECRRQGQPNVDGIAALRNAAPQLLAIADAAREFLDAYDIGHEEEHMFVDALRKALGGGK